MDISKILVDNTQYRLKLGETLESGFNLIEKGTLNIYKEINKIREDYMTVINKFLEYCEREGFPTDHMEDNYSKASLDNSICSSIKRPSGNNTSKYFKPLDELKKLKIDKLEVKKNMGGNQMLNNFPVNSIFGKPACQNNSPSNQFIRISNNSSKIHNYSRSKTPVIKSQINSQNNNGNDTPNNLLNELNNLPKISDKKITDPDELNKSSVSSYSGILGLPKNKNDLRNLVIFNPNNNYTKKFIQKQSIENSSNNNQNKSRSNTNLNSHKSNSKEKVSFTLKNGITPNKVTKPKKIKISNEMIDNSIENKVESINDSKINFNNTKDEIKEINQINNVNNMNTTNTNTNNTNNNININVSNISSNLNNNININVTNVSSSLSNNMNKLFVVENKKNDDRKFSILDIAGGPLVIESEFEELDKSRVSNIVSSSPSKKSELNQNLLKKLTSNNLKVLYLMAYSDVPPLKMRIIFSKLNKLIHSEYSSKNILQDFKVLIHDKTIQINSYLNYYLSSPEYEKLINRQFTPSKTAQNVLNFITKEDELNLIKEDFADSDFKTIFKFVFILLNYNFDKFEDPKNNKSPADFLINNILMKMKLDNIKSLFLNVICHNLLISNDQFLSIVNLVEHNNVIINPGTIIKRNKVLTYITFILKEIYEYLTMKTHDGVLILNLKKQKQQLKKLKEKLQKINNLSK